MKSYWNYKDSLDLEFFLDRDAEKSNQVLHERDRQLYLESIEPDLPDNGKAHPSSLLREWLRLQRSTVPDDIHLPGSVAEEVYILLKTALAFFGFASGCAAGFVYFSYSGATPVNVLPFLALFVLSQLGLALIVLFRQTVSRLTAKAAPRSLGILFLSAITKKGYRRLLKKMRHTIQTDHYNTLTAAVGRSRGLQTIHGRIFYWPLFSTLQLAGVCFNIGLLGSSLLKVTVSDIAFGWQSTLQISARNLHTLTEWVSLPWSWFMKEGLGFPTLADIEGSRIILKEGISGLMTENLISWWPFLLMSVLTYGLLVRILFFMYGKHKERAGSAAFEITTPAVSQLIRRMQTPLVTTQARPEQDTELPRQASPAPAPHSQETAVALEPVAVLVPDECFDNCAADELSLLLAGEGYTPGTVHRFQVDYRSDLEVLQKLEEDRGENSAGIVILMEAWMPPLTGFLSYLQDMRQKVGAGLPIIVRLIGKPLGTNALAPVTNPLHIQVWEKKIESLGDPYLTISTLLAQDRR